MSKEREAFNLWWSVAKRTLKCDDYDAFEIWQAAKAQAVPEGFVLVSKDTLNKALNPNDYDEAVCSANELLAVIEPQQPSSTLGCFNEP